MSEYRNDEASIKRRDFLKGLWGVSLLALFGQAGAALYRFFKPRIKPGSFGSEIIAGQVEEFTPGTVSHISSGHFYISRLDNGRLIALWHRCTHLGCTVTWQEEANQFHCPCHSSVFDTVGEVVSGPAPRPMDVFPITMQDKDVVVDTGNPMERDAYDPSQTVET